ncbi:ParB/RepB/Spo0J family partition protein [Lachnoclostridium sp. An169]|uniref:ParB/RepB/Spo0J family partition protein n=1 Tax=Lachnoclostridium sp. An169 TaxID=1965569 RepID=UPI003FA56A92
MYKTDLNELFSYQRKGEKLEEKEKVIEIEIERLRDFKEHPFHVKDDKEMSLLKESIKNYGILSPLIVRPVLDGVYEIVSGHRRKYAAQQLGYYKLPVIIRVMNDDEAIISMVDSNLQRERIRYSEKAFAYKMKNEAMKRKGGRKKSQFDHKLKGKKTIELIGEEYGDSPKQVQRFIKITELIPELLQQLDDEMIGFNPAVEINSRSIYSVRLCLCGQYVFYGDTLFYSYKFTAKYRNRYWLRVSFMVVFNIINHSHTAAIITAVQIIRRSCSRWFFNSLLA